MLAVPFRAVDFERLTGEKTKGEQGWNKGFKKYLL